VTNIGLHFASSTTHANVIKTTMHSLHVLADSIQVGRKVLSYITSPCVQNLAKRALNRQTVSIHQQSRILRISFFNNAVVDSRLRPRCAICCRCIRRQSQTAWRAPWRIRWKLMTTCCIRAPTSCKCHAPYGPLWENMMSSTEPEVHNVLHCRQGRTKPRPLVTCR